MIYIRLRQLAIRLSKLNPHPHCDVLLEHYATEGNLAAEWLSKMDGLEGCKVADLGAGNGKKVTHEVRGGTVGLVFDGRGRPLGLPEDRQQCQMSMKTWVENMELYEEIGQNKEREEAVATA